MSNASTPYIHFLTHALILKKSPYSGLRDDIKMVAGTKIHVCVVVGFYADLAKTWVPLSIVATAKNFDGHHPMVSQADNYWVFCVLLACNMITRIIKKSIIKHIPKCRGCSKNPCDHKCGDVRLTILLFADHTALIAESEVELLELLDGFSAWSFKWKCHAQNGATLPPP